MQGYGIEELSRMPQIVSGTSPEAEEEAAALFRTDRAGARARSTPIEAEFAKLFNNAYRYIEFAVTNQFYLIAKSAGLDYGRILQAMKHNYPRARNIPTPGFAAGPCLVKDTMQLLAFARNEFALGNAAILVNEGLPLHIIGDLRRSYDLGKMTIGLLGMAFKAEIDDAARLAELQVQEGVGGLGARGADHRSLRHHRSRSAAARRGDRAQRSPDPVHAAQRATRAPISRASRWSTSGDCWRTQHHLALVPFICRRPRWTDAAARHRHPRLQRRPKTSSRRSRALAREVKTPARVLICYDREDDDTLPAVRNNPDALRGPCRSSSCAIRAAARMRR